MIRPLVRLGVVICWLFPAVTIAETLIRGPGFTITDDLVEAELSVLPPGAARKFTSDAGRLESFINDLYNWKAIVVSGIRAEVDKEPSVSARLERARQRELVKIMRERQRAIASEVAPDFGLLAAERYRANMADFAVPEQRRIRHILLMAATVEEKQQRREEAEALLQRLQAGEDFEDAAKEDSEDPGSAQRGGDLGFFSRGQMVKPFEEAAFALGEPGGLSGIVETEFGLHILRLEEVRPARVKTFDEVKEKIIAKIEAEYLDGEVEAWRQSVVDPALAEVNQEAVAAFIERVTSEK